MSIPDSARTKTEVMDMLFESCDKDITSADVIRIVREAFRIDLEAIPGASPQSHAVIDAHLEQCGNKPTGAQIRTIINKVFSVNLDALSALEGARISLYSKDRWMVRHDRDLFVVYTGTGDMDVRISSTGYFAEQTGSGELPVDLINELVSLGYYCEENSGSYCYSSPTGDPVTDGFKGQTMRAVRKTVEAYSHL